MGLTLIREERGVPVDVPLLFITQESGVWRLLSSAKRGEYLGERRISARHLSAGGWGERSYLVRRRLLHTTRVFVCI